MKKWTVVVEITGSYLDETEQLTRTDIESAVSEHLSNAFDSTSKFQIMEIIEAPYGPQHKDGVFIAEVGPRGHLYKRQP